MSFSVALYGSQGQSRPVSPSPSVTPPKPKNPPSPARVSPLARPAIAIKPPTLANTIPLNEAGSNKVSNLETVRKDSYEAAKTTTLNHLIASHPPSDNPGRRDFDYYYDLFSAAYGYARNLSKIAPKTEMDARNLGRVQGEVDARFQHIQDIRRESTKAEAYESTKNELPTEEDLINKRGIELRKMRVDAELKIEEADSVIIKNKFPSEGVYESPNPSIYTNNAFVQGRAEGIKKAYMELINAIDKALGDDPFRDK